MHKRAGEHCSECKDPAYVPAHNHVCDVGKRELAQLDLLMFHSVPVTRSAHSELERLERTGGHREKQILALLASLERPASPARTHTFAGNIRETYIRQIGDADGVRIFWTTASAVTVVAVEHYPSPGLST